MKKHKKKAKAVNDGLNSRFRPFFELQFLTNVYETNILINFKLSIFEQHFV
jgi:hypothetical protein